MHAKRYTMLIVALVAVSCAGPPPEPPPRDGSVTTWIPSRGTRIPATFIVPDARPAAGSPLVVIV